MAPVAVYPVYSPWPTYGPLYPGKCYAAYRPTGYVACSPGASTWQLMFPFAPTKKVSSSTPRSKTRSLLTPSYLYTTPPVVVQNISQKFYCLESCTGDSNSSTESDSNSDSDSEPAPSFRRHCSRNKTNDEWSADNSEACVYANHQPSGSKTLNRAHGRLRIHPILEYGQRSSSSPQFDLARNVWSIPSNKYFGGGWWSSEEGATVKDQPATLPMVTQLRLVSPKIGHEVVIFNQSGVTVGDVIERIYKDFHRPLTSDDSSNDKRERERRRDAWWENQVVNPDTNEVEAGVIRRVELLHDTPVFDGLSTEASYALSREGRKDIAVLVMKFKRRSSSHPSAPKKKTCFPRPFSWKSRKD